MVNQLNQNGEMLPETWVVEKILRSLTNNFKNVVCAIEESKDLATFMVDELTDSLEAHEQRKKKKEETLDQALQTKASIKDEKVLYSQNFKVEVVVVEVTKMVEVVKAAVMKNIIRRRNSRAKQNGVEEDAVKEEAADQFISTLNATNVKNMVTMRMIVTSTNFAIVAEWGILQEIFEPIKGWKKRST